jgi:hypothetical protein
MTRGEAEDLRLLWDFVREWRTTDEAWKAKVDDRLRSVEGYVTGSMAERRAASRARISRRAMIGLALTAIGTLGSLAFGLWNALHSSL